MNKSVIRKNMKDKRKNMNVQEKIKADGLISRRLLSLRVIKQAKWLYLYVSYGTEVDTIRLIKHFFKENTLQKREYQKHIAVPKVNGDDMEFYEIASMNDLKEGYHKILEPAGGRPVHAENVVMIMPGLAFDTSFNRIGYGGGYYDRYLERNDKGDNILKIALAYDFQVLKNEITDIEEYDKKPDIIITEKNIYQQWTQYVHNQNTISSKTKHNRYIIDW